MVRASMSLQHSMCASLEETHVDLVQSLSTWRFVIASTPCCVSLENLYSTCLGAAAAVLSHKGSTESTGGPEGSVSGSGHLHWDPGLSAQPSSRHAPGRNEPRRISTGWSAGTNTHLHTHTHTLCVLSLTDNTLLALSDVSYQDPRWMSPAFVFCVCSGGHCRPCMSAGASAAGSLSVAPRPRRGNTPHTPAALDGPTDQLGIFSQRTQLLGQVITHTIKTLFVIHQVTCTFSLCL